MTYPVDFYEGGLKIGSGMADASDRIVSFTPFEGRGLAYRRQVQIAVTTGRHKGQSITTQIKGEVGDVVTLFEPMPFQEEN